LGEDFGDEVAGFDSPSQWDTAPVFVSVKHIHRVEFCGGIEAWHVI
jgi:hypothetical protein